MSVEHVGEPFEKVTTTVREYFTASDKLLSLTKADS